MVRYSLVSSRIYAPAHLARVIVEKVLSCGAFFRASRVMIKDIRIRHQPRQSCKRWRCARAGMTRILFKYSRKRELFTSP